jgi:hypothetical protein
MSSCTVLDASRNSVRQTYTSKSSLTKEQENAYQTAVNNLQTAVDGCMNNGPLKEIAGLQQDILRIQQQITNKEKELDIAHTRHSSVMDAEKKVSDYQGVSAILGIYHPIRKTSVPILIVLGIFLVIFSIYVLSFMSSGDVSVSSGFFPDFDRRSFLYGVGMVALIVGVLAYFGVYGRRVQ